MAEEESKRFANLLQPIKDLATTWNIDIAAELEQYLEELAEIEVTVESAGKFNFVEAALVIQGSTHVYSRKVELLHQLVYQALEHVVQKKESNSKVKQVQSIEDHTHLLSLKIAQGKDLENPAVDGTAAAPCLRRMPLFLMPREKTDRKRISHKIGGCAFVKSAVLLEESDALKFKIQEQEPTTPLLPPPPMGMSTAKKQARNERREEGGAVDAPAPAPPAVEEDEPMPEEFPDVIPDPVDMEFEDPWVQMDPHLNEPGGKPLKEGRTTQKPPARLLRPLAETPLTDPFGDSDLYEVAPLKGVLSRLGLSDLQDCEFLVMAEMRRQRRLRAEEMRRRKGQKDLPDFVVPDDLELDVEDDGPVPAAEIAPAPMTPPRGPPAPDVCVTPGSASKEQIAAIQKKIEDAQRSYEDVVQQRLQELDLFAGSQGGGLASVYASVRKWQDQLEPLLLEQEGRVNFDIHAYGQYILDKLSNAKDKNLEFFRIVDGQPTWQVFRYFLAALVLTNNGNLDIFSGSDRDFALSLLDNERPYALEDQEDLLASNPKGDGRGDAPALPSDPAGEGEEPAGKRRKGRPAKKDAGEVKTEFLSQQAAEEPVEAAPAKRRRKAA